MSRRARPGRGRILAAALAVLVLLGVLSGCGLGGSDRMTITAEFRDAVGLYVGNDVAVLGIPIGTVTRIEPRGTRVVVELQVDAQTPVPAAATAVTLSPSIVTDRRVELTPAYTGGPRLRDGDVIPLDRTRTPVEIDRVFRAVDDLAGQLATAGGGREGPLGGALEAAADTLRGNGEKLRRTVGGVADAVAVGADQRDVLVELIGDVDRLTQTVADNDARIRSFAGNLTGATDLLARETPRLVGVITDVTVLLDRTDGILTRNRGTIDQVLADLRTTTATTTARTRELSEALDLLPTLFTNLSGAIDPARRQVRVHASLQDVLVNQQLLADLCGRLGLGLPGCTTGRLADFGPDFGLTEGLLGADR